LEVFTNLLRWVLDSQRRAQGYVEGASVQLLSVAYGQEGRSVWEGLLPAHRAGRRRPRAGGARITRPPLLGEGGLDGLVEGDRVASGNSLGPADG